MPSRSTRPTRSPRSPWSRRSRPAGICVIFPEGRITVTGALMKVFDGPGMVADKADAPIMPVRIDGAQYTPFSRLRGKVRLRWFPKITLTVLPPRRSTMDRRLRGRERRAAPSARLYDVMSDMIFATSNDRPDPVRGAAARRATIQAAASADRRGHPPPADELRPADRRQRRARPRARRRTHARRGGRRAAAELAGRGRHLLRAAGPWPRAGDAQLHRRPGRT